VHLFFFVSFFVRSESLFRRPDRGFAHASARRSSVKVGRRTNLAACSSCWAAPSIKAKAESQRNHDRPAGRFGIYLGFMKMAGIPSGIPMPNASHLSQNYK